MGMFLNNDDAHAQYEGMTNSRYFVDKSAMIDELIDCMEGAQNALCFTRPRRFGKSVMANMVAAYFGKAGDNRQVFDQLEISDSKQYEKYLNQHNVIYIDFSKMPELCADYERYVNRIINGLKQDIKASFEWIEFSEAMTLWDMLSLTKERYIFVLDEWDAVFHMTFMTNEDKNNYLLFLKQLLKDQAYVELVYMTGVLPIAKYSSGSELNMFAEYSMVGAERFSSYFGFTDEEVDQLYETYKTHTKNHKISREDLRLWYDGYYNAQEIRLYNPRSIVSALTNNQLSSYWTSSGPYDEIFYCIKDSISNVREDIALMISGESVPARVREYAATSQELRTKNQVYSAMIVYGLLTYHDGNVLIPNKELMDKFDELLMEKEEMGYVHQLVRKSRAMLRATLVGDTDTMAEIMEFAHDTESPILQYNSEVELAAIVNLVYLEAREQYHVVREEKAGKGFADFIFYPYKPSKDCILLELKVNATPKEAILQIREKQYALNITRDPRYTGRILLVGIGYNSKSKTHACKVEEL